MTRSRDVLLRYHRWKVDEARRDLAALQAKRLRLVEEGEAFEAQVLEEQDLARHSALAGFAYGGFAGAVIKRRAELARDLSEIDRQIAEGQSALQEVFVELKRLEIMEDRRKEIERLKEIRTDNRAMDDIAQFRHLRRS